MNIKMFAGCSLLGVALQVGWFLSLDRYNTENDETKKEPAIVKKEEAEGVPAENRRVAKNLQPDTTVPPAPSYTVIEGSGTYIGPEVGE